MAILKRPALAGESRLKHAVKWTIPLLLAACFLAVWCLPRPAAAQTTGILSGRITNTHGQPLSVLVHLLSEGAIPAGDTYSDSNGTYLFTGLPSNTYTVVVEVEGYKTFRGTARLEDNIQPRAQVMVMLEPTTKENASKGPTIAGSKSGGEFNAKSPPPPLDPKALKEYDKGKKEQESGNSQAALEHYQKALRIDPNFYPALNNMGTIYERQRNHARAEEAFLAAIKINPDDGEAYINLGKGLYEEGQYGPAIERLNEGLKRSPQSAAGSFFLGSAYFKLHEPEKAEPLLKKACELDPQHMAPAHLQLANLYLQRHDNALAKEQLQTFLQMDPSSPQAAAIKKRLAEMDEQ